MPIMKAHRRSLFSVAFLVAAAASAAPDVPEPRMFNGQPHLQATRAHEGFVKTAQAGKTQLIFFGDSITEGWFRNKELWDKSFGAYQPANFGIGWDRTENVLWRLENGELDGVTPKVVVLMIGTNNLQPDNVTGTVAGITKIVSTIRGKVPTAKLLLLGILPRGEKPGKNPFRPQIKEVNATIARLADNKGIFFLDFGDKYLLPDGRLIKEKMLPDWLHLTLDGYQTWADAMGPKLAELMKSP
jgi:lysophospholipase L1-like esterase